MIVDLVLSVSALPVLFAAAYLFFLASTARKSPSPAYSEPHGKFDVIVAAHDEEAAIATTIASLTALDYPATLRRIIVVADNCSDETAARAREAGATVLERVDTDKRGKGHALAFAFERSLADGFADAFVVVEAGTTVSANLLRAFAARFDAGEHAAQARFAVKTGDPSLAGAFHHVRSLARERFGLSCALLGDGMAFSRRILTDVPPDADSLGKNPEYGIQVGLAGSRVCYVGEANVTAGAPPPETSARLAVARKHVAELVRSGVAQRRAMLLDLAVDVLTPNVRTLAVVAAVGFVVSFAWALGHVCASVYEWGLAAYFVGFFLVRGWAISSGSGPGLAPA